jgi:glycosyltransferase involved in cell wall biosynthesis
LTLKAEKIPSFKQGEELDCIIAHWCQFAPGKSGMYETVKELVKYENRINGVLAGIVEPMDRPDCQKGGKIDPIDDDIVTQSWNWGFQDATVHMVHFTQLPYIARLKPRVFMVHGSLEASLYSELDPSQHKFSSISTAVQLINSCDASIALHRRQYFLYKQFDYSNRLSHIRRGVDLERWKPKGAKMNLDGKPAVLYGEVWRHMKDPLLTFYAMYEYARRHPEAKFHIFNCNEYYDTWKSLLEMGRFYEMLGVHGLGGHQTFPEHWYRGAHMLISPVMTGEDSRVAIESLACGTPVITWDSNPYDDYEPTAKAKPFDINDMAEQVAKIWDKMELNETKVRKECVVYARENFDMSCTAQLVVKLCRSLKGGETEHGRP